MSETDTSSLTRFPFIKSAVCPFDPPQALRDVDQRAERVELWDGSTPWLVTDYELNRRLLTDPRISADSTKTGYPHFDEGSRERRKDGRSFVAMDEPDHGRLRRMVTAPFTARRVEALRGPVTAIVDQLIDDMLAGPRPVDLVSRFAFPTSTQVICRMLGVPYADHEFFQEQTNRMLHREGSTDSVVDAQNKLRSYLSELIAVKRADPAEDLISDVAAQQLGSGSVTQEQLAYMTVTLLVAGLETTGNMIALGTLALLQNPDQLAVLQDGADQSVVVNAVEELLRYLNISHSGRRRVATAPIPIGDRVIEAGDGVILASDVANRDPRVYPDPDRLLLDRDARHHLAFGYGSHHCLGRLLASLELEVVYGTLYRRIPTLRLAIPMSEVPFKHDGVAYGVHELPVTW